MRAILLSSILFGGLCVSLFGAAQAQTAAPTPAPTPEVTAPAAITCKDGTAATGTGRSPCRGHGGIQRAAAGQPAPGATTTTAPDATTPPAAATRRGTRAPLRAQAPGGGPGLVWVNTRTKVYHCPTDRYYGRTRAGSYMTEPAAKAAGARMEHGESC